MTHEPTIGEKILKQTKDTSAQVAALTALLNPPGSMEDPIATLGAALNELAAAVRLQTEAIEQMRGDISDLAAVIGTHD